jgi:hypothetical protein
MMDIISKTCSQWLVSVHTKATIAGLISMLIAYISAVTHPIVPCNDFHVLESMAFAFFVGFFAMRLLLKWGKK